MTRQPTRRIEFTVPEELGERYDEARGLIPMATWIKAIVAEHELIREEEANNARLAPKRARQAADAKRAVRPIPKGKR